MHAHTMHAHTCTHIHMFIHNFFVYFPYWHIPIPLQFLINEILSLMVFGYPLIIDFLCSVIPFIDS
jgi:hypothetical protein